MSKKSLVGEGLSIAHRLNNLVEKTTGRKIADIYNIPVDEWRKQIELKHNNVLMSFNSRFPLIGRGNVLRKHTISHAQIEKKCKDIWER